MKSYEFTTPRAAFGIAAVAMTALTFGLSVGAPLKASTAAHSAAAVVAQSTRDTVGVFAIEKRAAIGDRLLGLALGQLAQVGGAHME